MSPTPPEADRARMLADARLAARAARVTRIRRRLTYGAAAVFAACWAAVFDAYARSTPLGDRSAGTTATTRADTEEIPVAPTATLDDDGELQLPATTPQPAPAPAPAPAPLTTSQS